MVDAMGHRSSGRIKQKEGFLFYYTEMALRLEYIFQEHHEKEINRTLHNDINNTH